MDENAEQAWVRGNRAAWVTMLGECLRQLGYESSTTQQYAWIVEREQAIAALRSLCAEHGDNSWPNDLHLADIIEKHLGKHLDG